MKTYQLQNHAAITFKGKNRIQDFAELLGALRFQNAIKEEPSAIVSDTEIILNVTTSTTRTTIPEKEQEA